jgi:molybdenum cofactor cytidylyltransferase
MGTIKQLLYWRGKSFLEHAVNASKGAGIEQIVVVLGAHAEKLHKEVIRLNVDFIQNEEWRLGVGTSIRAGVTHALQTDPTLDGVVIQLTDQPRVTQNSLLSILLEGRRQSISLVASQYENSLGVPALFSRLHFSELLSLPDNAGAKSIFYQHANQLGIVEIAEAVEDIDTLEHYARLIQ